MTTIANRIPGVLKPVHFFQHAGINNNRNHIEGDVSEKIRALQ
jgi:hypothetical protein